ncbi:MAG: 2-polyprenyl-3-methyl-5-hydroxy-6-metoxy-1,4-benzoquinol methylase [Planctomycetota bacterium]|jgi:2-polyprenyl-3-methyl-5-hydroxy-6-metoxy-1,4-benzoquinol methylase
MTLVDKKLFNNKAHYLGRPADFDTKFIRWRVEFLKEDKEFINQDKTLIDIGCGNGATLFGINNDFKELKGVDINATHQSVFENYAKENLVTNCSFEVLNIEKENYPKQYDRLTSFEVIEHLDDDNNVKKYLELLKDDGIAIFSVPNKWWIFETHGANLPLLPWNRVPFFSWLPTFIHERFANARIYTKKRFINLLERNGYEILEVKYMTAPMDVLKKDTWFKRFLTGYIFKNKETTNPFLAVSIYVKAKKA